LQRWQRLGIERAGGRRVNRVFLRDGRTHGGEDQDGEQAGGARISNYVLTVVG
jgi:hypothetical protein